MIKNLSQLKKALRPGARFEIVGHCRPDTIGQIREVNIANTQGLYSIIPGKPTDRVSTANCGQGSWLAWGKAPFWEFSEDTATLYESDKPHAPEHLIISMKIMGGAE